MKEKILLVSCEGLGNGGVQAVIMSIVRNLSDLYNFDILLFTNDKRHYDDEFISYGGKIFRLPHYNGKNFLKKKADYYLRGPKVYSDFVEILEKNGPYKAIHCHNNFESALLLKAADRFHIPVRITHSHMELSKSNNFVYNMLNAKYLYEIKKHATHLIGCSAMACDSMFGSDTNFSIVSNPYNDKNFSPNIENFSNSRKFILTQVGRYDSNKNQLFTLSVLSEIKKKYPDVLLNFIGFDTCNYSNLMRKKIIELDLQNNVIFHESNADIPKILDESSAFIFPSQKEGFGIVLIEAQAMGLKCYVSDSVPRTTNVGGCKFLSLTSGPKTWAKEIIKDYEQFQGKHELYNCSDFSTQSVIEIYQKLYSGEPV